MASVSPDPEAAAHTYCRDGRVELEQVEQFILQLARDYKLSKVAYDPFFFARSAELLEKANRRLTLIEYLQAAGPMADAYQAFYQAAVEGRICHNNDPVFTSQINATVGYQTKRGWKLDKRSKKQRMDAAVAACLAHTLALHSKPKPTPSVFWMEN